MEAAPDPGPGLCCKAGGRLDMSHGLVHHIRRNQIARDDYDKKVKQAREKARRRHTPAPTRPRKPDLQVYLPLRGDDDDPGRVSEEVSAHTPLDLPMREALKLCIQEEIAKRQSRLWTLTRLKSFSPGENHCTRKNSD
ncbi:UPF0561 protein C2orf68-like protein [Sciurus carolinensis]|uniref:UPF0561 protein C2orf68-like protein n=1 Tax=Sciurus carolinensis TaxID=30640 RepID=A0AA41TC36_SCICA|nr:UPF0561 protein C2orf68-like protein [Sciurus carolinensis]